MSSSTSSDAKPKARRTVRQVLASYLWWTYPRGCFHYDVMVTLVLIFIFGAPHLWDFGGRATPVTGVSHPIQVSGYGSHGLIVTVEASDVHVPANATDGEIKRALRKAMEPVTGDAVFVERWQTITDEHGHLEWQIWAHR